MKHRFFTEHLTKILLKSFREKKEISGEHKIKGLKVLLILHVMIGMFLFNSDAVKYYNLWSCQNVCEALTFLLDNIYIRFGSKI